MMKSRNSVWWLFKLEQTYGVHLPSANLIVRALPNRAKIASNFKIRAGKNDAQTGGKYGAHGDSSQLQARKSTKTPLSFTRASNILSIPGSTRIDPAFALDELFY